VTSSGDESLGHTTKAESLGLPTSPFLFDFLYDEITLTTEFLYRLGLAAKLGDIGRMRRCESDDLANLDLAKEFITNGETTTPFRAVPSRSRKYSF
jgi:hypothetical protein